ncbi:uncharacterized protein LOC131040965 isoform X1 [Cryptomeria japonica]|uniref:uncharacterized protein LOC131040965 isoform X1 n=1 Tax=Cryptomeria japonica TaxID=3369 RepID=UPI0027DAA9EB|nr:uncharacterized protein LOC131040965 isoform X1 [Cryptomeria japonica]
MGKDERRKKKEGRRGAHQAAAEEQTEDEEEQRLRPRSRSRPRHSDRNNKHKLKLVLKLTRSYPSSSLQRTNSSSSSLAARGEADAEGEVEAEGSAGPLEGESSGTSGETDGDGNVAQRLPPALQSISGPSSSLEEDDASGDGDDDEDEDDDDDNDNDNDDEDDDNEEKPLKKRKLNAVPARTSVNGSRMSPEAVALRRTSRKAEKQNQSLEVTESVPGASLDPGSRTPMPEKKLVEFILDKLQKKDTYGVFSEPVDPEELPDYREVIKHPMDFGTIRKKLAKGDYACLEEFEKDVSLICTNAMHYNASITIYYKQARAIQELAKKKFESIRLDPERIEAEFNLASKTKPGYSYKKSRKPGHGRFQFEPASSDFSSGATLATFGDHSNWSNASLQDSSRLRRAATAERPGSADGLGSLSETKAEKLEDLQVFVAGSTHKAVAWRNGRRSLQLDENRRATYKPYNQVDNGNDAIFAMLDGEPKQLVPIGLRSEYPYAKSLAWFVSNAGPIAWKIAAQKIQRALPSGVPFGPGWVGEHESPSLYLSSQGRSAVLSGTSAAMPNVVGQSKVKSNTCADTPMIRVGELPKNLISECRSVPLTTQPSLVKQSVSNPTACQRPDNCRSSSNSVSDVNKNAGVNAASDMKVTMPSHEVKHGLVKAILPVATSNDLSLSNTKFGSEVTQSRLLEMVSRNNTHMHGLSLKQVDGSSPANNFQVKQSESMIRDGDGRGLGKEASDALKHACGPAETNAGMTRPNTSLHDYQAGCGAFQAPQATNSQGNNIQKSISLDNFMPSKMLVMHQRGSNMSANAPVFVNSPLLSTGPSIKRDDPTVQAWMQSQNAHLTDVDATSRNKVQVATNSYIEQHESQARKFSAIARLMPKEMQLDMARHALPQFSRFHSQNSAKLSNNNPVSCPTVESQGPKAVNPSYVQIPMGIESSKSQMHSWRGLPSQFLPEQSSDLSSSKPPDLNVGLQKPKSPARQSSGMLTDSQQPDLALQL